MLSYFDLSIRAIEGDISDRDSFVGGSASYVKNVEPISSLINSSTMSSPISLSTIQTNHISTLCKLCSNALVLVDNITFEWFRMSNIIGHLFCSNNRPTIKRLTDPVNHFFDFNLLELIFFRIEFF